MKLISFANPYVLCLKELGTTNEAKGKVRVCVGKQVLVPIGYGTEEMEAVILVDVLRRAGAEVTVASVESKLEVEASGGTRLIADTSISTCSDQVFDLIALPVSSLSYILLFYILMWYWYY